MSTHQLCWFARFCGALLLGLLALAPRDAEAINTDDTVNDTRDLPAVLGNLVSCRNTAGTCTLRAALQRANAFLTGTHTIRLPAGTFNLDHIGRNEDFAETGDLDIRGAIVIIGTGAKSTIINGLTNDRVFDVHNGSLILQDLTVTGGHVLNGEDGGGIRAKANLTLNRVHLHSNKADGNGGGIFTKSDLSVVRSTISDNHTDGSGGGI